MKHEETDAVASTQDATSSSAAASEIKSSAVRRVCRRDATKMSAGLLAKFDSTACPCDDDDDPEYRALDDDDDMPPLSLIHI